MPENIMEIYHIGDLGIKMLIKEVGCDGVYQIELTQDRIYGGLLRTVI